MSARVRSRRCKEWFPEMKRNEKKRVVTLTTLRRFWSSQHADGAATHHWRHCHRVLNPQLNWSNMRVFLDSLADVRCRVDRTSPISFSDAGFTAIVHLALTQLLRMLHHYTSPLSPTLTCRAHSDHIVSTVSTCQDTPHTASSHDRKLLYHTVRDWGRHAMAAGA